MFKSLRGKMFCFSPPVMLATFAIEFVFAFYTIWRYKMDTTIRLAFVTLIALGTFQLAEYMVCGGLGWTGVEWVRVGYASMSLLPAIGIHMIYSIAGKRNNLIVGSAYATCAAFVGFYLIGADAINVNTCYANYAVFNAQSHSVMPFAAYYYGWLMIGVYLAWHLGNQIEDKFRKTALYSMMAGYLVFIVPTTAFNIINPSTVQGIPSIMCGFAVLYAFILVAKVLPNCYHEVSIVENVRKILRI